MINKLGFSRITFIMMLGAFTAGTLALTQYAKAERMAHKHAGNGMCKMCDMPKAKCGCGMKKEVPQKKWCDAHGQRDFCHLKKQKAAPSKAAMPEEQGLWLRTRARFRAWGTSVRGWFKRSPKQVQPQLRDVGAQEFDSLVASGKPVVVKFHATWCPTCSTMRPVDLKVAAANPGVTIVQLDFEKNRKLATKHKVLGFPTYVFFKGGERRASHAGKLSEDAFNKKVQSLR